ncbi:NnrU family protein [Sinimarinibacterium thermocellulolyticum]|uniref:NnrU family protein n=1 Tax=Sinimarinibacterium thermocellulolyticum TaxID=3170016 RepID=A0ABV2A6I7_9GAMM
MLLTLGVFLWAAIHLSVALAPAARRALIERIGLNPYKGLFSLALVAALLLIVFGWRAMPPTSLWLPPPGMRHATMLLVPIAVILFISARAPTDIKRIIRHPQLTGVKLWAVAHLLANGETRSIILFGGLLAWAVLEVIFINRRDGAWVKPAPVGAGKTVLSAIAGLLISALLIFLHPWIAGRALI